MGEIQRHRSRIDLHHLTGDQVEQLRFVLDALSLHQLVQLAARVRRICAAPGYGSISISIEQGHPNTIEGGDRVKFRTVIDDEKLHSLME